MGFVKALLFRSEFCPQLGVCALSTPMKRWPAPDHEMLLKDGSPVQGLRAAWKGGQEEGRI